MIMPHVLHVIAHMGYYDHIGIETDPRERDRLAGAVGHHNVLVLGRCANFTSERIV